MNQTADVEAEIIAGVNHARELAGIRRVTPDPALTAAARTYSKRMAKLGFMSHTSPEAGLESPGNRVAAAGGAFRAVGENLAVHQRGHAAATDFVQGWLASKGHRDNLMSPDWERTGVGMFEHDDGQVFATQLFGIPHQIVLEAAVLSAEPAEWDVLRIKAKIGRGYSLAAFVSNQFTLSSDAAGDGTVQLDIEVPASERRHVSFGRRKCRGEGGWIGVYDGFVDTATQSAGWYPNGPALSGCSVHGTELFRLSGHELIAEIRGATQVNAWCIIDGERVAEYVAGQAIEQRLRFKTGTGRRNIDIGIPGRDGTYGVYAKYLLDTESGSLSLTR